MRAYGATCRCAIIREECLSPELLVAGAPPDDEPATSSDSSSISLDDRLRKLEANLIAWALDMTGGNKSKAAALLRVKRSTLTDRIARCGLAQPASIWLDKYLQSNPDDPQKPQLKELLQVLAN